MVFVLSRQNFLDLSCSSYVQLYGNKIQSAVDVQAYPQFAAARMPDEEKQLFLEELRAARYPMHRRIFLKTARQRLKFKRNQFRLIRIMALCGVRIEAIYYEDFCDDPKNFFRNFLAKIGLEEVEKINTRSDFTRVHKNTLATQVDDIDAVTRDGVASLNFKLLQWLYKYYLLRIARLSTGM
jgi:hypothetical protein